MTRERKKLVRWLGIPSDSSVIGNEKGKDSREARNTKNIYKRSEIDDFANGESFSGHYPLRGEVGSSRCVAQIRDRTKKSHKHDKVQIEPGAEEMTEYELNNFERLVKNEMTLCYNVNVESGYKEWQEGGKVEESGGERGVYGITGCKRVVRQQKGVNWTVTASSGRNGGKIRACS
ncbi:hypothetical protein BDQ12DRAFT_664442 [Crucibulum laeve]|uniref:Uncharacterized protein n=1 Tax=Crucibulum laeve TaxID=68775 RepID=A0A5C3M8I6_9AGAR|nr:hypothetical protein BDQ12DRAFT_664442 [Crucibulum laeve]